MYPHFRCSDVQIKQVWGEPECNIIIFCMVIIAVYAVLLRIIKGTKFRTTDPGIDLADRLV